MGLVARGLERPFLRDGGKLSEEKCRLDLSGNVHHYARYWVLPLMRQTCQPRLQATTLPSWRALEEHSCIPHTQM
jgi:hypothetical protein